MTQKNSTEIAHQNGDSFLPQKTDLSDVICADTFDEKLHIEWDPEAAVTPIGQLPFFIQYFKHGHLFQPWVDDCPLSYQSNNAPKKIGVLGSLLFYPVINVIRI